MAVAFDQLVPKMKGRFVLDGRGLFDRAQLAKAGAKLTVLGRSS